MRDPQIGVLVVVSPREAHEDRLVHDYLCAAGLTVQCVCGGRNALHLLETAPPDMVVLAPGAIDDDSFDTLDCARRSGFRGMILVVGRGAGSAAAVAALDRGADDYVPLCCDPTELIARARALARRVTGATPLERDTGGFVLDLRHSLVRGDGAEVSLTRREADLLEYLVRNAGHPVSREELATHIWHSTSPNGGTNIVDVYVSYLRRKLASIGRQSAIRSVRGVGYEFVGTRN